MAKTLPLEGPHKKHHGHGPDASVPEKGNKEAVPEGHWEKKYPCREGGNTPEGAFLPKRSKDRPQPYNPINETDH